MSDLLLFFRQLDSIITWIGISFLISLASQLLFYFFAIIFKTDKVTDLSYSLGFITTASLLFFIRGNYSQPVILALVLIIIWGLRLGLYLFIRIVKIKKDSRFDNMRGSFIKFSLFWILQSITVGIVLLSFTVTTFAVGEYQLHQFSELNTTATEILWISLPGIVLFIAGLAIETIADIQKFNFKNKIENKGKWIESGLWKYNRHPNFTGESMLWIGIYLAMAPWLLLNEQYIGLLLVSVISPIYITLMIRFVSGVPMLEKSADKRYGKQSQYQSYKKSSGVFFFKLRRKWDYK